MGGGGGPILVSQHVFSHSAASNDLFFFFQKIVNFSQKDLFMLLLKIILWYFDNYMTHCQGEMTFDYCIFYLCKFPISSNNFFSFVYLQKFQVTTQTHICSHFDSSKNGSK